MGDKSAIEWTDATWNPVTGCTKVSQGCKNCYAERLWPKVEAAERKREHFEWRKVTPRPFTTIRTHAERLDQPLRWAKPRRIFVNSMSDLFHEDIPFEFIDKVFAVMACTTRHTYQVLTKRPQRMLEWFSRLTLDEYSVKEYPAGFFFPDQVDPTAVWPQWTPAKNGRAGYDNCGPSWPLTNVWLGVSVEDQPTANERIPLLQQTPAAVHFISAEPLLGPIDLTTEYLADRCGGRYPFPALEHEHRTTRIDLIDWVIAGGESGPRARPSHPEWFRSLRDQCATAGVAYFFKQWGEWLPICMTPPVNPNPREDWHTGRKSLVLQLNGEQECAFPPGAMTCVRMGKRAAGRELDGRTHDEFPA